MLERYCNGVIRWHKAIVVAVLFISTLLATGMLRIEVDHDLRAFLNPGDAILQSYDEFRATYGANDAYVIVVVPDSGDVYSAPGLALVRELGIEARDIPFFDSVSSIAESPYAPALTDIAALAADGDLDAQARLREAVLASPVLTQQLVAADARAAAIRIKVRLPDDGEDARRASLAGAQEIIARVAATHPGASITLAGDIPVSEGLGEAITGSLLRVSVATGLLLFLVQAVITRSLFATLATSLVMALSVEATMGIFGWLGVKLTIVAGFVPAAIAALAVGDSMHLLVGYHAELRAGKVRSDALQASLRHNAKAIFITSATSILGVLTLNFSDAPPYREMGNMLAVGLAFAFLMSILLWPALMAWFPAPGSTPPLLDTTAMARLGRWVTRRPGTLIVVAGTLSLLLVSQAWRNTLTERWDEYLGPSYEARRAIDTVVRHFGGVHHVYYALDTGRPDGAFDPEYLATLDRFAAWQRQNDDVAYITSVVDVLQGLGFLTRTDGRLSVQAATSIKPVLRLAGLLGGEPGASSLFDADQSSSVVEVTFRGGGSAELLAADDAARKWLATEAPQLAANGGLGVDLIFSRINQANLHSMLAGALVALLVISLFLVLLLRSVWLGLVSLIPNLLPIGLAFGAWGLVVGEIDMAASVVMAISLGIVVDDTVHFLCKYDAARRAHAADAVNEAYGRVATAICISSLVLIVGMSGSLAADVTPTRETALLMIMTMFFATLADLFLLPPLLSLLDRRRS